MKLRTKRIWAGIGIALIVILITGGILGGIAWAKGWFNNDEEVEVDDLEEGTVTDEEKIDTASLGVSCYNIPTEYYDQYDVPYTADSAYLVTATLTGNIVDPVLNWSVAWNDTSDQAIGDYFTLQVSDDTWQCTVICEQPFGTQAVLRVERNSDSSKYCEIYLDYLASVSSISFDIDLAGNVTNIVPTYTTGTVYPEVNLSSGGVQLGTVTGATLKALDDTVISGISLSATAVDTGTMEYGTDVDTNFENYVTYFTSTYDCADSWNAVVSYINSNLDFFIENLTVDFTVSFDIIYAGEILKTTTNTVAMKLLAESASVEMKDDGNLSVDTGGIIFGGSESSSGDASIEYYPGMSEEEYDAHFFYNITTYDESGGNVYAELDNDYGHFTVYGTLTDGEISLDYSSFSLSDVTGFFDSDNVYVPVEVNGYPVTSLAMYCFVDCVDWCSLLPTANVYFANGDITIGEAAFGYCEASSITFGNGDITIGEAAFGFCEASSITFGNGDITIGFMAFASCEASSITFGNGCLSITEGAFFYSVALEIIYFNGTEEELASSALSSYDFAGDCISPDIICLK